jgi:TP901 family phage tail tape measure protein
MKAFVLPTIFTAVDRFTDPVKKMNNQLKSVAQSAMKISRNFALIGVAILAPLILAGKQAVAFEDRMADVAKTTGLAGGNLASLGDDLLKMAADTRTPIEGLQKIAEIGGQMGITGRKGIADFTDSVNKFNVALGSDFGGGVDEAARAIGGLNVLFKQTRKLDISESITRTGSAINALSAKGVQVPEITEYMKRLGALPDAIKPAIQDVAALGAVFNKAGITAEISSRATADVLLTASKAPAAFAKQMGISNKEIARMLNTNPAEFLKKFSAGLNGLNALQFADISQKLDLKDSGSIKVLGALSASTQVLTDFQKISNEEFAKGTSLLNEYNVKNNTTAANIQKAKNNFESFSIMIGTQLLPIINDLLKEITPVIKSFTNWAKENKPLVTSIIKIAIGLSSVMFIISAVSATVAAYATIMSGVIALQWAWGTVQAVTLALQGKTLLFLHGNNAAMFIYNSIMKVVTAAQWAWNAAMTANPIGLIIVAIAALVALVVIAIKKYNEWGAAVLMLIGPLGWVINLIQSFRRNWDMVTKAFSEGGILEGLKAIGAVFLDSLLYPMQQLLELVARFTNADWANSAVQSMKEFRADLGVQTDEAGTLEEAANPQAERNDIMTERMESTVNNRIALDINDPTGRTKVSENKSRIPITVTSTHKFGM